MLNCLRLYASTFSPFPPAGPATVRRVHRCTAVFKPSIGKGVPVEVIPTVFGPSKALARGINPIHRFMKPLGSIRGRDGSHGIMASPDTLALGIGPAAPGLNA